VPLWAILFLSAGCEGQRDAPSQPPPAHAEPTAEKMTPLPTAPSAIVAPSNAVRPPEASSVVSAVANSVGMKFVLIPAGNFLRGSPDSDPDAIANEKPEHIARITKPFYLGVFEVTQAEYQRVMGYNPSFFTRSGPTAPVEKVTWEKAQEFCQKLSSLPEEQAARRVYRLPTAAEWEYACLAGARTRYCFGDDAGKLGEYAWFGEDWKSHTHPVGQKKPNAWGLYDMHGNVWEWCADYWTDDGYATSPREDPRGARDGSGREDRGGSFGSAAADCRAACRSGRSPVVAYSNLGLRVAFTASTR
jgi:eukaryotic-like serine/threonine-protein kinase